MDSKKIKKLSTVICLSFLLAGVSFAITEPPDMTPSWRGTEGSTYQQWSFSDNNPTPVPDASNNPYGDPLLHVDTPFDWIDDFGTAQGIWPLSGEIDIFIPNRPETRPFKEIWIYVVWQPGNCDQDPFLPEKPIVGITPFEQMEMSCQEMVDLNGWMHSLYKATIWPNPPEEWITVKGDILVDDLTIDTRCIPEPATVVLLGIGCLAFIRRKRNR